jgi:hypothetical protein
LQAAQDDRRKNKGKGKKHDFPAMSLSAPSSQSKARRNKVAGSQNDKSYKLLSRIDRGRRWAAEGRMTPLRKMTNLWVMASFQFSHFQGSPIL